MILKRDGRSEPYKQGTRVRACYPIARCPMILSLELSFLDDGIHLGVSDQLTTKRLRESLDRQAANGLRSLPAVREWSDVQRPVRVISHG